MTDKHHAQVLIGFDRRRGIGSYELALRTSKGIRSHRAAITTGTEASGHSLQSLALLSALSFITRKQATELSPTARLNIQVQTADTTFADALRSIIQIKLAGNAWTLRAGGNFRDALLKQIGRFNLDVQTIQEGFAYSLNNWSDRHVFSPDDISGADAFFAPVALGALGPRFGD